MSSANGKLQNRADSAADELSKEVGKNGEVGRDTIRDSERQTAQDMDNLATQQRKEARRGEKREVGRDRHSFSQAIPQGEAVQEEKNAARRNAGNVDSSLKELEKSEQDKNQRDLVRRQVCSSRPTAFFVLAMKISGG